jgi:hypothetical protein
MGNVASRLLTFLGDVFLSLKLCSVQSEQVDITFG